VPIAISCPSCARRVRLPDDAAGRRFRCPNCHGVIPTPAAKRPVIRPEDEIDSGFVDESAGPNASMLDDAPTPITSIARKAAREEFNPFAEPGDEEEKPRHNRYFKPKDDYNPFADPPPSETAVEPEQVFDFGVADEAAPPTTNELDFDSTNPHECDRRRRRRR
jgi:hypothetical protein